MCTSSQVRGNGLLRPPGIRMKLGTIYQARPFKMTSHVPSPGTDLVETQYVRPLRTETRAAVRALQWGPSPSPGGSEPPAWAPCVHEGRRSMSAGLLGAARVHAVTDYAELSRRIQAAGLLKRRYAYYWCRMIGLVSAFAGVWVTFALLGNSWFQLIVAAVLAAVVTQFGFLGHDGAHRQIFASHAWNEWVARVLSGAFAGLSYTWWSSKHNRHHGAPNQEGKDPDIAPGALAFTPAIAAQRKGFGAVFAQYQGW